MTKQQFDDWWERHPHSVSLAATRYAPVFCEVEDFRSELYLHCSAMAHMQSPAHAVSHWICLEAVRLRDSLKRRAQREARDWRVPVLSLDDPIRDDLCAADVIFAPEYPIDAMIDGERALGSAQLTDTQRAALRGAVEEISDAELGKILGLSASRICHARSEARRILAKALQA